MENQNGIKFTYKPYFTREDLFELKEIESMFDSSKIPFELAFSADADCELKKIYYSEFNKLPKTDKQLSGGLKIVEDERVPKNTAQLRTYDPKYGNVYFLVGGKIYCVELQPFRY